jgi:hypothetical protein
VTDPDPLDARALLTALVEARIEFIVVGGFAVGAHGFPRATKDVDLVPSPERTNLERLADLLRTLDSTVIGTEEFDPTEIVHPDLEGLLGGGNWVLRTRFGRLDIMQYLEPDLDYAKLDPGAIEDEVFGLRVRFCGYEDLVAMKEAAGRDQDLVDLSRLRAARGEG